MVIGIGIIAGLWAAMFQSLSYLATRHFVQKRPAGGTRMLLVIAHLWMGAASLVILPFCWPDGGIRWHAIALPLFGTAFFYLLGQFGLMLSLRDAQPSQVAPMLAIKLLILAALTVSFKGDRIVAIQWLAVAACISGTFVLNYRKHDRLAGKTILILILTCLFYSLSDFSISYLNPAFGDIPRWQAIMCGSLLCYGFCGLAAIGFVPWMGSRRIADWRDALPYSATWLLAVFGLFASFALVGVVYGGILQSTRSIIGVGLAALLTKLGHTHIEHLRTRGMFYRRLVAALLMVLAVLLWGLPKLH